MIADPTSKGDPGANLSSLTWDNVNTKIVIVDSLSTTYSTSVYYPEFWTIDVGDETTSITTGTAKKTVRAPYAITLTSIPRATLANASGSGIVTVDINANNTSILGVNKLSVDSGEKTSVTAATPTTLANTSIADDTEITIDVDSAGTDAKGLKVTLYFRRG